MRYSRNLFTDTFTDILLISDFDDTFVKERIIHTDQFHITT